MNFKKSQGGGIPQTYLDLGLLFEGAAPKSSWILWATQGFSCRFRGVDPKSHVDFESGHKNFVKILDFS